MNKDKRPHVQVLPYDSDIMMPVIRCIDMGRLTWLEDEDISWDNICDGCNDEERLCVARCQQCWARLCDSCLDMEYPDEDPIELCVCPICSHREDK